MSFGGGGGKRKGGATVSGCGFSLEGVCNISQLDYDGGYATINRLKSLNYIHFE